MGQNPSTRGVGREQGLPAASALTFRGLLRSSVDRADKLQLWETQRRHQPVSALTWGPGTGAAAPAGSGAGRGGHRGGAGRAGGGRGAAPSRPHKAAFSSQPPAPAGPVIVFDKTSLASAAEAAAAPRSRWL